MSEEPQEASLRPELLPTKASYGADDPVAIEVRHVTGPTGSVEPVEPKEPVEPIEVRVFHLGNLMRAIRVDGDELAVIGTLPVGGYGVEAVRDDVVLARTAVDVQSAGGARLRYGFVSDYEPDRDLTAVAEHVRRRHLTGVQFYDWAYRHANLLGGGAEYRDPLGRVVSLATVRELVRAVQEAGSAAIGYAAVYGVGSEEWPTWKHDALLDDAGTPYSLADFLQLVDPAAPDWLAHLIGELVASTNDVGFDGFHLDQYGYPRIARRVDGSVTDVATSFVSLIRQVRSALPDFRLVFNNVNDFPTWRTGGEPQDAVYVEVWPPNVTLESLAAVAVRARALSDRKPIVVAAYQSVYARADAASADRATQLTMATLFSHGATQLLVGEGDNVLVDPYYPRHHRVGPETSAMLTRWYDFAVEHDELLFDSGITDVTAAYVGAYNDECDVHIERPWAGDESGSNDSGAEVRVTESPVAGAVWRRVNRLENRLIVHLVNLVGQSDTRWDDPRAPFTRLAPGRLRVRSIGPTMPRVMVADPDVQPRLMEVEVHAEGHHACATLPAMNAWQVVVIDYPEAGL